MAGREYQLKAALPLNALEDKLPNISEDARET
jgi:hypothetical protein